MVHNGQFSKTIAIPSRGPQGSVLGPILFPIYTADISSSLSYFEVVLYAEDTQITHFLYVENVHLAVSELNSEMNNLFKYSESYNL